MVTVAVVTPPLAMVSPEGALHVVPAGNPVQPKDMVPPNPGPGAWVKKTVAVPGEALVTVTAPGLMEIWKSGLATTTTLACDVDEIHGSSS